VFGTSVIVAITAQNTIGVHTVHDLPGDIVSAQLDAALAGDLPPHAVKTGMLSSASPRATGRDTIQRERWRNYVLDPVMVATSGTGCSVDAEATVRDRRCPSPRS
jgi:hydroxymethylpyrimidine kinase/phosphomethylpyrimidine kinase